jgi:hypothetical protein
MLKFKRLTLLLALSAALPATAQIVNIEARRLHTDSVRFAGRANLSFSFSENNTRSFYTLNSDFVVQAKSKNLRHLGMLLGGQTLSRAGGQDFANALLGHARYNYKFSRLFRMEAFQQIQKNGPLGVGLRSLTGAGPRLKLVENKTADVYFGTLYMYEYEETRYQDVSRTERQHRLSAYASFGLHWDAAHLSLTGTTYYQPVIDHPADYRLLTENRLDLRLWRRLHLFTNLRYLFDSRPVEGVKRFATGVDQGLGIQF